MTSDEFHSDKLTDEQRISMQNLQRRSGIPWAQFLESAIAPGGPVFPYVGINDFHGMFVGIEPDGHTHT